jgi:hypothetical protein
MNRRGLTLIELVLAIGLFALMSLLVVRLLDSTMRVWTSAEGQRYAIGTHADLSSQVLSELDQIAGGENGELLIDWELFDTDGDGTATRPLQRVRFVRRATAADLVRLGQREIDPQEPETARMEGGELPLLEVVYALLPRALDNPAATEEARALLPGEPGDVVLWRGERLLDDPALPSVFRTDWFRNGFPPAGAAEPLHGGLLWFEVVAAGRGTRVDGGWKVGLDATDATRAWDSRGGSRLRTNVHAFNRAYPDMPTYRGEPLLPRRMLVAIEVEAPSQERRRPVLEAPVALEDREMRVTRPELLPPAGTLVLLGEEWVKIAYPGAVTTIERAQRGTSPRAHRAGTPVQVGRRFEREIALPLHREDWRR